MSDTAASARGVSRRVVLARAAAAGGLFGLLAACQSPAAAPTAPPLRTAAATALAIATAPAARPAPTWPAPAAAPGAPAAAAASGGYPVRPIEVVVGFGPGGGSDLLARTVAPLVEQQVGQPLPVLNVAGAAGAPGVGRFLRAPADGYTIATYVADTNAVLAAGQASWQLRDFVPLVRLMNVPSFLFVREDSELTTFDVLEKRVRARPNEVTVATVSKGSVDDVALTFMSRKGFQVTRIPISAPSERYRSILAGQADVMYEQAGDVRQFLDNRQMRPLLIFDQQRIPELPAIPTSREKGYEVYLPQFRGVLFRAGVPQAAVDTLAAAFRKVSATREWKDFASTQYMTPDSFLGPADWTAFLEAETRTLAMFMKEFGFS